MGMLAAACAVMAVFISVERRSTNPLVPLRIFRSRLLVGGNLTMTHTGMLGTVALTLMAVVGAYGAQAGLGKIGVRATVTVGMVLLGAGALLLTGVQPDGDFFSDVFFGLLVFGLGLGGSTVVASSAALSQAVEQDAGGTDSGISGGLRHLRVLRLRGTRDDPVAHALRPGLAHESVT